VVEEVVEPLEQVELVEQVVVELVQILILQLEVL
jgi:hypothetical protein|tara:strand:- start:88 stop:189 length:102 start_codon:yes stop_codon:yes gene_type:complete